MTDSAPRFDAPVRLISNLQGYRDLDISGGCVAFIGDQDSGKSSSERALIAGVTGEVIGVGKTPAAVRRLAPEGQAPQVQLIAPSWSAKYEIVDNKLTHAFDGALAGIGSQQKRRLLPVHDLRGLLSLKSLAARAEVFRRFGGVEGSVEPPADRLTGEQQALWRELLAAVDAAAQEAEREAAARGEDIAPQDVASRLAGLVQVANREKSQQGEKKFEAKIQELAAQVAKVPETAELAAYEAEFARADRWEKAAAARAELESVTQQLANVQAETVSLTAEQQAVANARAQFEESAAVRAQQLAELAAQRVSAAKRRADLEADIVGYGAIVTMFERAAASGAMCELVIRTETAETRVTAAMLKQQIAPAQAQIAQLTSTLADLDALLKQGQAELAQREVAQRQAEADHAQRIQMFRQRVGALIQRQSVLQAAVADVSAPTRPIDETRNIIAQIRAAVPVRAELAAKVRELEIHLNRKLAAKAVESIADERLRKLLEQTKAAVETAVNAEIYDPSLYVSFDIMKGAWTMKCRDGAVHELGLLAGYAEATLAMALPLAFRDPALPAFLILDVRDLAEFTPANRARVLTHFVQQQQAGRLTGVYVAGFDANEIPAGMRVVRLDRDASGQVVQLA